MKISSSWPFIDRFQSVEAIYEPSRKPNGFSIDNYLKSGALGFPVSGDQKIKLKILFDKSAAEHLHESPLSSNQIITDQADGRVLIKADVLDTQQLRWWLLGFGQYVEVVAPESLRKEFAETIRNMASLYGVTPTFALPSAK